MSSYSTPLFADDWWGSSTPAATTLTSVVSASSHDAVGFKFNHTRDSAVLGFVVLWAKSAAGTPTVDVGIEHLTNGLPSTTANYVGSMYKAGVTPTPTTTAAVEMIEFLPGEVDALVVGGSYALTIRYAGTDGGKTIAVSMLSGTATGGGTRNSVTALTKAGAAAFIASASRAVGVLVYEDGVGVNDTTVCLRNLWPATNTTLTAFSSASADEVMGMKWLQGRPAFLSGISWFGQVANTVDDTAVADVVLFEDDTEVYNQSFEFNAFRNGGSSGTFFLPLTEEVSLSAGKTYRMCIRGTQATRTISLEVVTFFPDTTYVTAAQLRELLVGPGHLCTKNGGAAWADSTDKVCSLTPITHESLADAVTGGGNGMICAADG